MAHRRSSSTSGSIEVSSAPGRVDVKVKQDLDLEVRIPEWIKPEETRCTVNGSRRTLNFSDRYALIGRTAEKDVVVLEFPIHEKTERIIIEKHKYSLVLRGNDVVWIDPPGKNRPLYQRGHYRNGMTLLKKTLRFVPEKEVPWC